MYGIAPEVPELQVSHEAFVAAVARFLRPALYVELGCQAGGTFRQVVPHVGEAIAVDIQPLAHHFAGIPNARFVQQDSIEFVRGLEDEVIDLCFIDSSHQYDATIAEFEALVPKLRPNGVALFHDAYPPNDAYMSAESCGRVCDAIPVLKERFARTFEFVTLPAQFGVTIARKYLGEQLLWRTPGTQMNGLPS